MGPEKVCGQSHTPESDHVSRDHARDKGQPAADQPPSFSARGRPLVHSGLSGFGGTQPASYADAAPALRAAESAAS